MNINIWNKFGHTISLGETRAGKTTLLTSIMNDVANNKGARITIEDTPELELKAFPLPEETERLVHEKNQG